MKLKDIDTVLDKLKWLEEYDHIIFEEVKRYIDDVPTVEAIPRALYEQIRGERDVALSQLKQLNIELFEKPYLKAIPIDWIEEQIKTVCDNIEAETFGKWLIKEWKKENETKTN